MIINPPSAEDLNDIALRLYFSSWSSLVGILDDFDEYYDSSYPFEDRESDDRRAEEDEYLNKCQSELQSISIIVQQSNEIALKSRICEVSPYILIVQGERRFSEKSKDYSFSDLRTIDAVDLPSTVNSVCSNILSKKYIKTYHDVRSIRNKVTHLGLLEQRLNPRYFLKILILQYIELWSDRKWLQDRMEFETSSRHSTFYYYKYFTPHGAVFSDLPRTFSVFSNSQFQKSFGVSKTKRRYRCHECIYNGGRDFEFHVEDGHKTAVLSATDNSLTCLMCGKNFDVSHKNCKSADCRSMVIADNDDNFVGYCHGCGYDQEQD